MDPIQVTDADVKDPTRLRIRLAQAHERLRELLVRHTELQAQVSALVIKNITPEERKLLRQLSVGSTSSAAPASTGLAPEYDVLPPVATAIDGQLAYVGGRLYRFKASTGSWGSGVAI